MKNRYYSHSATHHTTLSCAAWREEEVPSSHTEAPPATLSEAGQQEAPTSAASEKVEEEGNVISVHCTASLWRRGTSIPHGYLCSTVFPQSAPSSRLLTPQEKNTEKQNHALPKKKREKRKKKLRTKRRSVAKKERTPILSTGFKGEAGRTRCKKSNNAVFAAKANNNTAAPIPAPGMEFRKRRSFQVGTGTCIMLS